MTTTNSSKSNTNAKFDIEKIDRAIQKAWLTKKWSDGYQKDFILSDKQALRISITPSPYTYYDGRLHWVDMDCGKKGIGETSLVAHALGVSLEEAARRLVDFICLQRPILKASSFEAC